MKSKLSAEDKKLIKAKKEEISKAKEELFNINEVLDSYEGDDRVVAEERIKDLLAIVEVAEKQLKAYQIDGEINSINTIKKIQSESEIITELIKRHHIGYLCEDNKYVYCLQMANSTYSGIINPQFSVVDTSKIIPVLNKMCGKILSIDAYQVRDLFQSSNNDYYRITGSFNGEKWDSSKVYNKMKIIQQYWVQPIDEPHDSHFDFLMHTVSGGKQENIDHLEQWVAYKWLYPERNANIPNIDIGGYPGGNGKGRFIELLKTIFTHGCVVPAAKKELLDGFNASWETAVVLCYDEPTSDDLPEGKLKNATGSEEQRIEKKGIDAYTADRNFNFVFTSNNPTGVVKLAGTGSSGEDRRWSVISTDKVMVDEFVNRGLSVEEAKIQTNEINNIIKNREAVGRWLCHIIQKHDVINMAVLHPLHGEDYHARIESQKDRWHQLFDLIMPVFRHCGVITLEILTNMAEELAGVNKATPKAVTTNFNRYLKQNRIEAQYVKNTRVPLLHKGAIIDTVQLSHWRLDTSNTNWGLEYTMFCTTMPGKNINIMKNQFTIKL